MGLLTPETEPPTRPNMAEMAASAAPANIAPAEEAVNLRARILYLRSYLLMRALIGFLGLSLPVVLVIGDNLLQGVFFSVRHSLSVYYYSGMRDVFVGSLSAVAVFLITYKVFERSLNNLLSIVAGLAAVAIALFPTGRPDGDKGPLTPVQERLGELNVAHVHYTSAAIFIVSLAIITFFFGVQEGRRSPQRVGGRPMMSPTFWRWFHWTCAAAILLAVAFIVVTTRVHKFTDYALLVGESVAIVSFGLSWLMKGLELEVLLGPQAARRRLVRQAAAETE